MNSKKLSEMIKKWQRLAAMGRRRSKGHFVVYTKEGKRFVVPLCYLNHPIFRVLLEMAEEEFGSMVHGPLKVPCEEDLMDYIVSLLKRNPPCEVEKALVSITTCRGTSLTSSLPLGQAYNQGKETMVL
ncbi:auxin-induced protein 6B-like protein [Cinnamomum micranthum f. kanehirae]|uniref:Auxin-induced protein 6B-like protein n=1 Tax=Cinnamomum micranthum f. kanehirae TaxID=337451 RepID=A0A443NL95_9MAGN|nr:auxin-induced protein 6B-like protein [Cinnamomum micranthum f. kanehirae]